MIGLPGKTIALSGGRVVIDGHVLPEPWLPPATRTTTTAGPSAAPYALHRPYRIPSGDVYVMGDNRPQSCDSRYWGPIPESAIVGKVDLRIWPSGGSPSSRPSTRLFVSSAGAGRVATRRAGRSTSRRWRTPCYRPDRAATRPRAPRPHAWWSRYQTHVWATPPRGRRGKDHPGQGVDPALNARRWVKKATTTSAAPPALRFTTTPGKASITPGGASIGDGRPSVMPSFFGNGVPLYPATGSGLAHGVRPLRVGLG